ncbi:MAG: caspase domain-containing protein, partial [Thiohalomonadales bacterium]
MISIYLPHNTKLGRYCIVPLLLFFTVCALPAMADRGLVRNISSTESHSPENLLTDSHYYAIVIGNNNYNDPEKVWSPLKTAISDATTVYNVLTTLYGFKAIKLIDASRRDILNALSKLRGQVGETDNVLVYYAGHGWMNPETNEAYWIPVDAVGMDDSYFLSNSRIKEKLSTIADQVSHTLLVSDSCFSGTLLRGKGRSVPDEYSTPYFQKVAKRKSVQILAAGGNEFVDDNYRNSGHSPYTYFFVNELKNNQEKYITVTDLSSTLARLVSNNVLQTPQSGVLYGAGDEGGEFIFRRTDVATIVSVDVAPRTSPINISTQSNSIVPQVMHERTQVKLDVTSGNESARSRYLRILEEEPNNQAAKLGLKRIANSLVDRALDGTDYKR